MTDVKKIQEYQTDMSKDDRCQRIEECQKDDKCQKIEGYQRGLFKR